MILTLKEIYNLARYAGLVVSIPEEIEEETKIIMKIINTYKIKKLEKQLKKLNSLPLCPNVECAIDRMYLKAEIKDKITRLRIKL